MVLAGLVLQGCEGSIFSDEPQVVTPTTPTTSPDVNPFRCDAAQPPSALDARRLSRAEYQNALSSLLSRALGTADATALRAQANVATRLPPEGQGTYSTGDTNFSVLHATAFFEIADAVATGVGAAPNYERFVATFIGYAPGTCTRPDAGALTDACEDALIRNFLLRAWGRPVEEGALNDNDELASFRREFAVAASSREGVEAMVLKALIAPQFLFHLQVDLRPTPAADVYALSSHAIARRLSFSFGQTLPSEALLQFAATNDLTTDEAFTQALALAAPSIGDAVTQFSREWLHLDSLPAFTDAANPKSVLIRAGLTANDTLRDDMRDEVLELWRWVNDTNGTLTDVFTSDVSFARSADLMRIYGQLAPAPAVVTAANAVRFGEGQRSGLLTRAAMLTSGGHTENPILRGIHLRRNVLCLPTPQPGNLPPNSLTAPLPDGALTTRERYHNKTSMQPCQGCHQAINPLGFALSRYNALGSLQPTEPAFDASWTFAGELATDASAHLLIPLGIDRTIAGGVELGEVVAGTSSLKACITRNFFTWANGLQSLPSATSASCEMSRMYESLSGGAPLRDFFQSAVADSRFRQRTLRSTP